jgi:outer membrane biosynthesis protein TonB
MKISLVIESDTPEEFAKAISMLATVGQPSPGWAGVSEVAAVVDKLTAAPPKPKPEDKPTPPATPEEPRPAAIEPEVPATPAAAPVEAKKTRGRPKKAAAAEPAAAVVAPAAPAPAGNGEAEVSQRDVLMDAFRGYVLRYGTGNGYSDVSKLLSDNFGPEVRKSSDVTDENLPKAIVIVRNAIDANPFQRRRADVQ